MITLTITDAAAAAIDAQLKQLGASEYLPAIVWAEDDDGKGEWEVGYHKTADVPESFVTSIGNLKIVIEPHWSDALESKTLDVVNGHFRVR